MSCEPGSAPVQLTLNVNSTPPQPHSDYITFFSNARDKIPTSHASVKTIHKGGVVQLQVPASQSQSQGGLVGAEFFPEQQDVIDHTVEPKLSVDQTSSGYLINLSACSIGAKPQSLKGVLVVHTSNDSPTPFNCPLRAALAILSKADSPSFSTS